MDRVRNDAMKHAKNLSEGVLRENHDHVPALTELIKMFFFFRIFFVCLFLFSSQCMTELSNYICDTITCLFYFII